jgi:polyhydroxyalkanoate synthesis regulator phasin
MAERPLWRQAFDAVDRRIAGPVEGAARSDVFGDVLALTVRAERRLRRELERRTRRALHFANLPTASDVRRLSEQVAELRRELRELEERRG